MKVIISTKKRMELLNNLWRTINIKQKKALLKARGLSLTWAKTKTIKEMVNRGGGMIARDLLNLIKIYTKRNPEIKRIIFRGK